MSQLLEEASLRASLSHADCVRETEYQTLFLLISSSLFLVFSLLPQFRFNLWTLGEKKCKISDYVLTGIFEKRWLLSFVLHFSFVKVKPQRGGSPKHSGSYADDSQTLLQFSYLAGVVGGFLFPHRHPSSS